MTKEIQYVDSNGRLLSRTEQSLKEQVADHATQLAQMATQPSRGMLKFMQRLQNGQVTKIKLIGDSITEGQGANNHTVPSTNPVIFDDGAGNVFHEGCYTCNCWANLFRNYVSANFPTVQFINAGIGGKSTKWANTNKQYWVSNNEDIVIVQLGTNDRWDCTSTDEFKTNLTSFLDYVNSRCNLMIVMTATPTTNDISGQGYYFYMKDVDRVITELCIEKNYVHLSNYREVLREANAKRLPFSAVLQTNGSHPIDLGHKLLWFNMQLSLGLIDNSSNWEDDGTVLARPLGDSVNTSTPVTSFKTNQITVALISTSHADLANFPEQKAGRFITFRPSESDLYAFQEFHVYNSNNRYRRYYNGTNWSSTWINGNSTSFPGYSSTSTTPITSYPKDSISLSAYANSHSDVVNFPEGVGGTLLTYRLNDGDDFGFQEYYTYQASHVYKRIWQTGTSTWGSWRRIGGNFYMSTTQRQALSAVGLSTGDWVFDYTLGKPLWVKTTGPISWIDATGATVS